DLDLTRSFDRTETLDPLDLILLHQKLNALGMFLNDPVLPLNDLREVEHRLLDRDAFFAGIGSKMPHIRRVQQRFGRDTAHMQARTAQLCVFLNNGRFQPILSRADRRGIPARSASNNDKVVSHAFLFYMDGVIWLSILKTPVPNVYTVVRIYT